jgi:hypothetical protein
LETWDDHWERGRDGVVVVGWRWWWYRGVGVITWSNPSCIFTNSFIFYTIKLCYYDLQLTLAKWVILLIKSASSSYTHTCTGFLV